MPKSVTENLSVNNLDFKQSVRVATTANITLSGTQTIDGISVVAGDRVLVKNQTTASQNGIYVVGSSAWYRSLDANEASEFTGNFIVFVEDGTLYKDTGWILTTNNPITIGSTSLTFTLLARASDSNGNMFLIPDSTGDVGISTLSPNARLHVYSSISGDTVFNVEGTNGSLFSITDSMTGSLMSVNNNAGLPIFEVFSTDKVVAGRFGQNDLVVNTDGKVGLGTGSPSEKLEVGGNVKITGATAATTTGTGSLIVTGGTGVSGNIYAGGIVSVGSTTDSTTTGTGSLIVAGGVGIAKKLYVGDNTASTTTGTGAVVVTGGMGVSGNIYSPTHYVNGAIASTTTGTGSLIVTGGTGVSGNVYAGGIVSVGSTTDSSSTGTGSLIVAGGVGIAKKLYVGDNTASTTTGTGAVVVTGGMGVSGNIYSPTHYVNGAIASTTTGTGSLIVTGGTGVSGNVYAGGIVSVGSTTDSTTTGTGSLIVAGGVGIAKKLRVGDNTASTTTGTGAVVVTGGMGVSGNTYIGGSAVVTSDFQASTLLLNDGFTINPPSISYLADDLSIETAGTTNIVNNTPSTSTASGSLVVVGGVGIGGNLNVGGNIANVPSANFAAINIYLFQNFK